jgi:hypothetical protein
VEKKGGDDGVNEEEEKEALTLFPGELWSLISVRISNLDIVSS